MFAKRVFYLATSHLTVYHWRGGALVECLKFEADEPGLAQFSYYLDRERRVPSYFLVDVVEEEFREETMPHVFGRDRRALVRTKQNRLFRDARYAHAIFQGRESEGRRDDRVLFTALIRPDLLSPWLAQIARHKVPLAGVYSLPVVSESLLKKVGVASDHALLVTLQSFGALRQTFFHRQQLKISRLAVIPRIDERGYASYILGEVEKIRRYLNSLRLLPRDNPLDVYILCHGEILGDIRRHAVDSTTTRHHLMDVADVAPKVGLKQIESSYADVIFARLLARDSPGNHYARQEETRYFRLHRLRVGMLAASVLLALGSVAWSGFTAVKGVIAAQQREIVNQQIDFYSRRYEIAQARLPNTPVAARELKRAVEAVQTVRGHRASPLPTMVAVSKALAAFPNLELDELGWTVAPDERQASSLRVGVQGAEAAVAGGSASRQVAHIRGRVVAFEGDYREALNTVNAFADALLGLANVDSVEVVSLPLDISPENRLTGSVGAGDATESPEFELQFTLKRMTQ